jgi:uncharacterized protein YndB with AHSA1/START domain
MTEQAAEDEIVTVCELDAPPDKVWRALTVPELVAAWLLPNDLRAGVGAEFDLAGTSAGLGERIACKVLAMEPNRLLRYGWRDCGAADDDQQGPETVVTFHLSPTAAGGTVLRIVHGGFAQTRHAVTMSAANSNTPMCLSRAA